MERYDAIVLGIGGIGSAALYHAAKHGARVLGVDRFRPPHDRGSTHGQTRVIRQAYFEHPAYVPLLRESYSLWHDLEIYAGKKLFHQVGLVEIGPSHGTVVPGVLRAAEEHSLEIEWLLPQQIMERWPGLRATEGQVGVFEKAAGYLMVEDCVAAHLNAAEAAGAEILIDTEVASWRAAGKDIVVRTTFGVELAASRLIITAGPWAGRMLADLGVPLTVLRKPMFWFETPGQDYNVDRGMPVYLFELNDGVFYGFPRLDVRGVKVAEHSGGRLLHDPLAIDRSVDPTEQRRLEKFVSAHLPGVKSHVTNHATCLYTMSPDEHFIVDHHPTLPQVVFAAGLSGHGFKFAPALGRALAEMALAGRTKLPLDFLSLDRFAPVKS